MYSCERMINYPTSALISAHIDTYSEESIKYIPRAPMLSAKTNTT